MIPKVLVTVARLWVVFLAMLTACTASPHVESYGSKVRFTENQTLIFPDFKITYHGERRIASTSYPRGFLYHDFLVENGKLATVSWTSGAGDIAPTPFVVSGKQFKLELGLSDKLGPLGQNTLVIWRR